MNSEMQHLSWKANRNLRLFQKIRNCFLRKLPLRRSLTFYPVVEPYKGQQPQLYFWNEYGGFSARSGEEKGTLLFIGKDDQIVKRWTPKEKTWEGAPEELTAWDWDEQFISFTANSRYVLADYALYGGLDSHVMKKDDQYTIVDALLYDTEGSIIKKFPPSYEYESQDAPVSITGVDEFELSMSKRRAYIWISDDVLAIPHGAWLFLYSVSRDELKLVHDASQDVYSAWCEGKGDSFGIIKELCFEKDGVLYYGVGEGNNERNSSLYSMWRAGWDTPPEQVLNTVPAEQYAWSQIQMSGQELFIANWQTEPDWDYQDIFYLDPETNETVFLYRSNSGGAVCHTNGLCLSAWLKDTTAAEEQRECILRGVDLSGNTIVEFDPSDGDGQPPMTCGVDHQYAYTPLGIWESSGGYTLYYCAEDHFWNGDDSQRHTNTTLVRYNTATKEQSWYPLSGGAEIFLVPSTSEPTHFIESANGRMRVRSFAMEN